ncbi:MAG TPA: GNAT family N-acetyltransferase [Actinomycetota bacterium]|nr:GNAT family N-acetyltransferase [Actinomycetota bacterium]
MNEPGPPVSSGSSSSRPIRVAHVTTVDLTLRFLLLAQLRRLRDEGYEVVAISAPGPWAADLRAEGIRHIPWPGATRAWDPRADVRAGAELLRILRRERFDLVHTHNPKPGILGRVVARAAGVPCVVNTVHGLYATPDDPLPKRAAVLGLEALASGFSDLELFQSEEDLRWAVARGVVARDKAVYLGNGTDVRHFDPAAVSAERLAALRRELGIEEAAPVVGTVGRLVAEKGYRELFRAVRAVRRAVPGIVFLLVGETDPDKPDAIGREELADLGPAVRVTGWRPDVRDLLALMDVFVLASWREGVPRSAIEAAAMGRAMVLTDIRGCREVARHDREALLVPPRDAPSLAGAVTELLRDPERRRRLGQGARRRALARFDERRVEEVLLACYEEVLGRKGLVSRRTGARRQSRGRASAPVRAQHETPVLRPARPGDEGALARLHREGLPEAFLPRLGEGFLRLLYRAMAEDPGSVVVVAEADGAVVGFACGVASVRGFYRRFFRRRALRAALAAAPRLLRPDVARRALETARYPSRADGLPDAELLAIAVDGGWRRRGLGERLARGVVEGLGRRGASELKVVVGADNRPANRFYARVGFQLGGQLQVHDGRVSNVWVAPCRSS